MNSHENARLTAKGRARLIARIGEIGISAAAAESGVRCELPTSGAPDSSRKAKLDFAIAAAGRTASVARCARRNGIRRWHGGPLAGRSATSPRPWALLRNGASVGSEPRLAPIAADGAAARRRALRARTRRDAAPGYQEAGAHREDWPPHHRRSARPHARRRLGSLAPGRRRP